jgi:hypothetical protein
MYYLCPVLRIASIVLLCAVLQTVVGKTAVWVWFKANEAYIAQTLCENKAKPAKKCNGKCQLAKQLKKADGEPSAKQAPTLPAGLKEIKEAQPETIGGIDFSLIVATTSSAKLFKYIQATSGNYSSVLLRPPIG